MNTLSPPIERRQKGLYFVFPHLEARLPMALLDREEVRAQLALLELPPDQTNDLYARVLELEPFLQEERTDLFVFRVRDGGRRVFQATHAGISRYPELRTWELEYDDPRDAFEFVDLLTFEGIIGFAERAHLSSQITERCGESREAAGVYPSLLHDFLVPDIDIQVVFQFAVVPFSDDQPGVNDPVEPMVPTASGYRVDIPYACPVGCHNVTLFRGDEALRTAKVVTEEAADDLVGRWASELQIPLDEAVLLANYLVAMTRQHNQTIGR